MAVQITRKKAEPVQPVAQDEALEAVGLSPAITIIKKTIVFPIDSKVRIISQFDWVSYYQKGDTGVVLRRWDAPKEAKAVLGKTWELDLYEILLDNPRDMDHFRVLLRRHEIEAI